MTCIYQKKVTIASGAAATPAIDLEGNQLCGIVVPAEFDGSALAVTASDKIDGTYLGVQAATTASTAWSIVTTASRYVPIDNLNLTAALQFIKLTSNSNQSSTDTVLTLILRNVQ